MQVIRKTRLDFVFGRYPILENQDWAQVLILNNIPINWLDFGAYADTV